MTAGVRMFITTAAGAFARVLGTAHARAQDFAAPARAAVARVVGLTAALEAAAAAALAVALALALVDPARAQDFAAPAPPGPSPSALVLLDRGLPLPEGGARIEAASTRWFGLPELTTRAAALEVGWRSLRSAAGVSQTGDPELGWSAVGLAIGAARPSGGAAVRAVARRDRDPSPRASALGRGVGLEAGGGAWVRAAPWLRLWVASPQVWARGVPPPLARGLEAGVSLAGRGVELWLVHSAPVRVSAERGAHAAGLGLSSRTCALWLEARDRPLRGGFGLSASARGLIARVRIESHPDLGETVALSLGIALGSGAR